MLNTKYQTVTFIYLNVEDAEGFLLYTVFLHNENINSVNINTLKHSEQISVIITVFKPSFSLTFLWICYECHAIWNSVHIVWCTTVYMITFQIWFFSPCVITRVDTSFSWLVWISLIQIFTSCLCSVTFTNWEYVPCKTAALNFVTEIRKLYQRAGWTVWFFSSFTY